MPELGRWTQVDPLWQKYPGWSPYNYALNNPLKYVDPDGREVRVKYYAAIGPNYAETQATADAIATIESRSAGAELVGELRASDKLTLIDAVDANYNSTRAWNLENSHNGKGSNSTVFWVPEEDKGGTNTAGSNIREPFIGLTHELFHALINARGTTPRNPTQSQNNAIDGENAIRAEHGLLLREESQE
ncbi:M91 family zinc metallopeptidase [Candidatus Neomarinimicrobiota bacterium]